MKGIRLLNLGLIMGLVFILLFIGGCVPSEEPQEGFDWTAIMFLALIFGLLYLVLIRPSRKRQKQHDTMVAELKRGDRVVTTGGLYGQIESVSEDSVVLRVAPEITIKVARNSVALREADKRAGF